MLVETLDLEAGAGSAGVPGGMGRSAQVEEVEAGGVHVDEDFVLGGNGVGSLFEAAGELGELDVALDNEAFPVVVSTRSELGPSWGKAELTSWSNRSMVLLGEVLGSG